MADLVWCVAPSGSILGGDGLLFAQQLQHLGATVTLVARVGPDGAGEQAIATLQEDGFDVALVQRDDRVETSQCKVALSEERIPIFADLAHGASDYIVKTTSNSQATLQCNCFYSNARLLRTASSRYTVQHLSSLCPETLRVFDAHLAGIDIEGEILGEAFRNSSLVRIYADETDRMCDLLGLPGLDPELLAGAIVERFKCDIVVVSDPLRGVYAVWQGEDEVSLEAELGRVVSLFAWQSAFLAGMAYGIRMGHSLQESCELGRLSGERSQSFLF